MMPVRMSAGTCAPSKKELAKASRVRTKATGKTNTNQPPKGKKHNNKNISLRPTSVKARAHVRPTQLRLQKWGELAIAIESY